EEFIGFTTDYEERRIHSHQRPSEGSIQQQKKPRGRPPRTQRVGTDVKTAPLHVPSSPTEKIKRLPGRPPGSGERRRGRPPASASRWIWQQGSNAQEENIEPGQEATSCNKDSVEDEKKEKRQALLGSALHEGAEVKVQKIRQESKVTKLKRLKDLKLNPLKSKLRAIVRKTAPLPCVQKRGRGRPPSAKRLKAEAAARAANSSSIQEMANKASGSIKNKASKIQRAQNSDVQTSRKLRDSLPTDQDAIPDTEDSPTTSDPVTPTKVGRPLGLRQSPRHIKPVRVVPPTKRTDATIAKQLLQRAKKGAQKKKLMEKDAVPTEVAPSLEGAKHRRRTQLTNIRQFIMPVVSTVSLRIIKTPKRFIEDEVSFSSPPPQTKIARVELVPSAPTPQPLTSSSPTPVSIATVTSEVTATPGSGPAVDPLPPPPPPVSTASTTGNTATLLNSSCNNSTSNGRFSSSAASCGSSAVSQHSSQLSSGESSRSSSPSLDDSSCDSQGSEGTQALFEEADQSPPSQGETEASRHHASQPPSPLSEMEPDQVVLEHSRRGRRGQSQRRGDLMARGRGSLIAGRKEAVINSTTGVTQTGSHHASSTASSSASPPPLLSPPQPPQAGSSNATEHHSHSPWMSHSMASFLPTSSVLSSAHGKSRSILREPTFRWTSLSCGENKYFSSAKYAKEGLIRKPTFDNFRPPPLTPEDVGLIPPVPGGGVITPSGFPSPGGQAGTSTRLFSPLHHHPRHNHHQHSSSRFDAPLQKRSPILRPPFFTPSPAHSRIFESVTLPSSSGSSPGSLSPLQVSPTSNKKRKGSKFSRGQPRSPSHSMTTRSSQSGPLTGKASEQSVLNSSVSINMAGNPLPGVAVSPLAPSALTQACFSGFPLSPIGLTSHGVPEGRRTAGNLAVSGSTASSSHLFPIFTPSPQGSGEVSGKSGRDPGAKDKDREMDKSRDLEKENKRDGRRDWEKRVKNLTSDVSSNSTPRLFSFEAKEIDESLSQKKTLCRKKSVSIDSGAEACPSDSTAVQPVGSLSSKGRPVKKGRSSEKSTEVDGADGDKDKEKLSGPGQSSQMVKTTSIGSILARAEKQPVTDRRVARLLGKAKAQLNKIEKREVQPGDQPKLPGQENDSSETPVRGPRIKHVCRRAAVALGRNRAVFPDDMPTLSALPWEEREKILSSMGNDDKSSVAGSEEAEPPTPPIKPVTRQKMVNEAPPRKGRRSRRCGQCPGCQIPDDCGVCTNCLDKPKFGGRNIKKQCCKVRKCQNLQWMPSKFLQKQAKGKRDRKRNKSAEKKESHHKSQCSDASPKPPPPPKDDPPPRKKSETPPPAQGEDKQKQTEPSSPSSQVSSPKDPPVSSPPDDHKHSQTSLCSAIRKERKQLPSSSPSSLVAGPSSPPAQSQQPLQQQSQVPAKKDGLTKSHPSEFKKKSQQSQATSSSNTGPVHPEAKLKKQTSRSVPPPKPKLKEKPLKTDSSTLNSQSTPSTGDTTEQKVACDGVHRIRVDFKEDYDIENVWAMGGLSILTSVPITPRVVCFLCASSGNVEVCCEPFHLFCLGETERPHKEQWENWCCRRCRFCHVCGRKYQKSKLLECDKCRNSYHPECLGPNHPTRSTKKKRVWICSKCVRCKSCGATKPGKTWDAQWSHDFSLCHDCAKRLAKGNSCPVCNKGYDVDDCDGKMMKCKKCDRWVHAKCENLTDDMCELLSSLPERVSYTCANCTKPHSAEWHTVLEKEIHKSMQQVLTALLNSHTSTHLLRYRQTVMKPPELNPESEESLPSRRSPEGPDPPVLTEVTLPSDSPLDLESVEKKMDSGCYKSVPEFSDDIVKIIQTAINSDGGHLESRKANIMLKCFFVRQMERIFPWYKVKESKFWEKHNVSVDGLISNAVLPLSLDHNYAQSKEREEKDKSEQSVLMKTVIPVLNPKAPEELNSLSTPAPPPQAPMLIHDPKPEDTLVIPPPPDSGDNRKCALCLKYGDEDTNDCGRLLYIGQNEWIHVNCALWSAEVFEDIDCALKNVHMAVSRGKQLQQCAFLEDRKVFCRHHRDLIKGEVVPESGFEVTRRVLVDIEEIRQKFVNGLEPDNIHMMIGSMTIDCLGMLTELSDCESKLFPVGYQCSRVYWSTTDARKRCVYKCRILVCRPSLGEIFSNNTAAQELDNTSDHSVSPALQEASVFVPGPTDFLKSSVVLSTPKPCGVYFKNRHPSYPSHHRTPLNRPLPSPDGFTSSAHEIVTVGDPLLISTIRSIGSRRHCTSSISVQQLRKKVPSPPLGDQASSQKGSSSVPYPSSALVDPLMNDVEKGKDPSGERALTHEASSANIGAQCRLSSGLADRVDGIRVATKKPFDSESLKSSQPASISQVSPPLATAVLTGHKRGSGSLKNERGKQATKETDLPPRATFTPSHPLASLPKDNANPIKEGDTSSVAALKDSGKTESPQRIYTKNDNRKSYNYVSSPALNPLATKLGDEDIKHGSAGQTPSHRTSRTKEKNSKVKLNTNRDASTEKREMPQNQNSTFNTKSKSSKNKAEGRDSPTQSISNKVAALNNTVDLAQKEVEKPFRSKGRLSFETELSSAIDAIQTKPGADRHIRPPLCTESTKDISMLVKKCTEKPLKSQTIDPNGNKAVGLPPNTNTYSSFPPSKAARRSSRAMIFSPSASSESSESESHFHPDEPGENLLRHPCPDDGEENNLEDDGSVDKHHEEDSDGSASSAKRRYPRRSARARSNMFFGLTPFYGVRSYGEEDIPFYKSGEISMKRRAGSSKRSAEGQVDGADDMSTSTSGESGEDEGVIGSNKEAYYYNFTRTIINPSSGLPSIAGIDQCLGRGSQMDRFLRDQEKEQEDDSDEVSTATKNLELQQIGQLDGVDDGSESDISISTSSTTTATTSTHKSVKRKGRESRSDKSSLDSGKEAVNATSSNGREGRKNQKDNCLPLGSVKSQDALETPLTLSTDLLKADSDNINSDDCGNILPSDIMEFVLNTPSMQALAQQTETPSAEPFTLDESYGVDVNQRKDILFDDFTQPLANAETSESGVSTSIAVEEPYDLPLELPSDLSVLTTRSPTVNNQNHASLISETSDRPVLALAPEESKVEKPVKKTRTASTASNKSAPDECNDAHIPEEHFIPSHVDGDHIASPGGATVGEAGSQDLTRTTSTPGLPNSPTVPLPGQKFVAVSSTSSGPAPVTNPTIQANASPLKTGPEKLIVLNQHLQPLYVLQTLPNGVTQKIQIAPSVSATGVMNTSTPVLTGISGGISSTQSIFPAGSKSLVPVSHHAQIQAFTGTTQTGFQHVIPNPTSGLLIGVTSHDPQIAVTEAGNRHDHVAIVSSATSITPAPTIIPSGQGKKRLISRLQSPKSKKQARSKSQPTLAPSDIGPNMTLINLSPSQLTAGISAQASLMELGTITATATSHRKIPNIIKRPKQGVMYLEPTLLPQPMPISTTQPSMLGHDPHLIPCTVPGLNPSQSVLNVVSVPPSATGNFLGGSPVSLSAPGLISSTEITGSISNLLIKANPHNLSLPEQPMVLHSGTPMMSHLTSPVQTSIASSICVFPPNQSISMSVNPHMDKEGTIHLQHPVSRILADKTLDPNISLTGQVPLAPNFITQELNKGHVVGILTQSSRTSPISRAHQHQASKLPSGAASTVVGKGKQKVKRPRIIPEKSSGKKHKGFLSDTPTVDASAIQLSYIALKSTTMAANASTFKCKTVDSEHEKPKNEGLPRKDDGTGPKGFSVGTPGRDGGTDSFLDYEPKKGLMFEICSEDGFQIRCESIEEAWKSLTDKVQEARSNARLKALSFDGVDGLKMMGVVHDTVVFLLEQLYGARHCRNYRFRFHKSEDSEDPPLNPHGSARAEVYHRRSVLDMFNFLASKHRKSPLYSPQEEDEEETQHKSARRATITDMPLIVKLKELKRASRDSVGVYRSAIHGRGLFCRKNIEAGDMVIEYSGNVIRSVLTEKREKHYDHKNIGCYMFRIDDYEVVDATMHGNAARFINHSCEPNCYSRVVSVDGQKHIVIFATRKIYKGEELTYDYKFPIEEPGNKLPCNCRAKTCRKFLN
ncbi:hypothetical protein DNTS_011851, partial [Danionella cerebrum]